MFMSWKFKREWLEKLPHRWKAARKYGARGILVDPCPLCGRPVTYAVLFKGDQVVTQDVRASGCQISEQVTAYFTNGSCDSDCDSCANGDVLFQPKAARLSPFPTGDLSPLAPLG
jgi:hypothetical protein